MKRISIWTTLAIICALLLYLSREGLRQPVAPGGLSPLPNMTGKWLQQARVVNGKMMDDPQGAYLMITDDGRMEHHVPNGSTWMSRSTIVSNEFYRVDRSIEPATVDVTGRSDWTDLTKGIWQLNGDTLTLCYAAKNQPRPTVFSTDDDLGAGSVLMVFQREQ